MSEIILEVDEASDIRVFDALGSSVPIQVESNGRFHRINPLFDLPAGIYILTANTLKGQVNHKLVRH